MSLSIVQIFHASLLKKLDQNSLVIFIFDKYEHVTHNFTSIFQRRSKQKFKILGLILINSKFFKHISNIIERRSPYIKKTNDNDEVENVKKF